MLPAARITAAICLSWLALSPLRASATCAEDESEQCLLDLCACVPDVVVDQSKQAAGLVLEQWLIESHDQSMKGAMPIPAGIREKLKGFVDKAVLDTARYKIDDGNDMNLANLNLHYGDLVGNRVAAVTLIDVIVFRDARMAADASVWAHELHHVKQFREWGVHDFAMRYARDFHEVEDPAYDFQSAYERSACCPK